ncbi:hypothetical protein T4A_6723 [Trichinella pseudospiralis]|uniref:Uncharacterized protein n=1 Tax=Trichinella pseudospiralis TaxID=6337 RepID=A0A0V1E774_TRIPS|nr:hypothetical protein T4A_6723 [Trichinella pseudospiralis]
MGFSVLVGVMAKSFYFVYGIPRCSGSLLLALIQQLSSLFQWRHSLIGNNSADLLIGFWTFKQFAL